MNGEQMYTINWQSKITGFTGQGTHQFTKAAGQKYCDDLNKEYAGVISHWLMPVLTFNRVAQ